MLGKQHRPSKVTATVDACGMERREGRTYLKVTMDDTLTVYIFDGTENIRHDNPCSGLIDGAVSVYE